MSDSIAQFVKAFLSLTPSEKKRVLEITKALDVSPGPLNESRIIKSFGLESLGSSTTVNFAPLPGSCPTCGK
ncbi:hypothetical protein [Pseudomonas frederiksbergensis]|uniref:hypothetical protein n=1 Tax=Pseudomonas frederiksbergensis TaxID=104087 RepID=UPI003D20CB73